MSFAKKKIPHKYYLLFRYFKPHKRKAIIGGIFMLFNVALLLPTPLLTLYLIDKVLPEKNVSLLCLISILTIVIIVLSSVFASLQQIFFQRFNESIVFKMQLDLFNRVQALPHHQRKKMQTGYLMSRVIDDPERLHSLLVETAFSILKDVLTLLVGIILVFYIHWKLACIAILLLPAYALIFKFYNKKIRNSSTDYYEKRAQITKKVQESISLHDLFKLFNAYKYDAIKLVGYLKESVKKSIYRTVLVSVSTALLGIISGVGPIFVIWYGLYEIMHGRLTLGELIAFNSYIGYLFGPTNRLIKVNLSIQQSLAAWERIYEYLTLNNKEENKSYKINKVTQELKGEIVFNQVSFSYDNDEILKKISLNIPPKSVIGILGKSGCGKTTMMSLITMLHTNYSGEILIDGINIKDYDIASLRGQIAVVSQEPSLFCNTIFDNIQIGNRLITYDKIVQACKTVNIHDFILSLPEKYNTIIDERATNLSIGQKQRIAIARAIARDPKILILDEPTSNLDIETERLIYSSLSDFIKSRTTIIITHRVAINLKFDAIISLRKGIISTTGNYNDLYEDDDSDHTEILKSI